MCEEWGEPLVRYSYNYLWIHHKCSVRVISVASFSICSEFTIVYVHGLLFLLTTHLSRLMEEVRKVKGESELEMLKLVYSTLCIYLYNYRIVARRP